MRKGLIIFVIILVLIIGGLSYYFFQQTSNNNGASEKISNEESSTGNLEIKIENFIYSPKTLTIKLGETVVWTNLDSIRHTITSDSGSELDSALLSEGEVYSHTFNNAGSYKYHCAPHPFMKGEIIVE